MFTHRKVDSLSPMARSGKACLSVVVPCFNEEEAIAETHRRLLAVLVRDDIDPEIVYVDDGSRDRTLELLKELQRNDRRVRVVAFSRNFGHQFSPSRPDSNMQPATRCA